MKEELDKKLVEKYPKLYKDRWGNPRHTAMCWGFPGDGWYDLLDRLSAKIEPLGAVATQVKEKFGELRFYYYIGASNTINGVNQDAVDDAIGEAEEESKRTCEACGEPGKMRGGFWLKCLCDICSGERDND